MQSTDNSKVQTYGKVFVLWIAMCLAVLVCPAPHFPFANGLPMDHPVDFVLALACLTFISMFATVLTQRRHWTILLLLALAAGGLRCADFYATGRSYSGVVGLYHYAAKRGEWELVRSINSREATVSRIDSMLDFQGTTIGPGRSPLWLDFLNDLRFEREPLQRLSRPLRITWHGVITPDRDCVIALESSGQARLLSVRELSKGQASPLYVEVMFDSLVKPSLRLFTTDNRQPVPPQWLSRIALPAGSAWGKTWLWASHLLVAAILILSGVWIHQSWRTCRCQWQFALYAAILLIALGGGIIPWEYKIANNPHFHILPANDYLIYETEARTLLLQGFYATTYPYHRSPAMPYYLASMHMLFGENGYGIMLLQQILRGVLALLAGALWFLLTRRLGWAVAVILAVLFMPQLPGLSLRYWAEVVAVILGLCCCYCFIRGENEVCRGLSPWFFMAGCSAGLFAIFRTNAIAFLVAMAIWMGLRRYKPMAIASLLVPCLVIVCLVPLRNRLVCGQWVVMATQGPISIVVGNNIPRDIKLPPIDTGSPERNKIFYAGLERLLDFDNNPKAQFDVFPNHENYAMQRPLMQVFYAYVRQYPGHFFGQLTRKTLRFFFPLQSGRIFLFWNLLAFVALVLLVRNKQLSKWSSLAFFIAVYAATVVFSYFTGRHRLVIMPEMLVMSFYTISLVATPICLRLQPWWQKKRQGACIFTGNRR
jgi:hypothetical protein